MTKVKPISKQNLINKGMAQEYLQGGKKLRG